MKIQFNIRGPFGSSFQGFDAADFVMLIGGGSVVADSLSLLRQMVCLIVEVPSAVSLSMQREHSGKNVCGGAGKSSKRFFTRLQVYSPSLWFSSHFYSSICSLNTCPTNVEC